MEAVDQRMVVWDVGLVYYRYPITPPLRTRLPSDRGKRPVNVTGRLRIGLITLDLKCAGARRALKLQMTPM